jgi:hypothetical protein
VSFGHKDAEHTVLAQGAHREGGRNRTVNSAGKSQNDPTAFEILAQEMAQALTDSFCFGASVDT